MARLILDAGAVIAVARGDPRVAAAIRIAVESGNEVVVPAVVVAQTTRGGPRDAPINRLLNSARVPFVGLRLARRAGELLGTAVMNDVADALIMAEALRAGPSVILTSDPDDMTLLAAGSRAIHIVPV